MSQALTEFETSLVHADNLIKGTKSGAGKPSAQEASMFVASVALTYAAWEAYVEDVAVEVADFLAVHVDESKVPPTARSGIEADKPTTWELAVHPGWRELWRARVRAKAKGDSNSTEYGMNTARPKQINTLFNGVGLEFFDGIDDADQEALEDLVTVRGTVVHSASAPARFKKAAAKKYRDLVQRMASAADESLRAQAEEIVGSSPW